MGFTREEVVLENGYDAEQAFYGALKTSEVRSIKVEVLVDTGAKNLVINEEVREKLGLKIIQKTTVRVADGGVVSAGITNSVKIRWGNRICVVYARVLPRGKHCVLGVIPLEEMNLMVDPINEKLIKARGKDSNELAISFEELDGTETAERRRRAHR